MSTGGKSENRVNKTTIIIILAVFLMGMAGGFTLAEMRYGHILMILEKQDIDGLERAVIYGKLTGNPVNFSEDQKIRQNFTSAMDLALSDPNPYSREYQANIIIQGLPITELQTAINYVESLQPGPRQEMALALLMRHWGRLDGRSAIAYALSSTSFWQREMAIVEALQGWAVSTPADAWNWALTNPGKDLFRSERINTVLIQIANLDPETAFSLALTVPDEAFAASALENISNQFYARGELDRLLQLVDTLPQGIVRRLMHTHIAIQWGQYEPQKAADWTLSIEDSLVRREAIQGVVQAWVTLDPLTTMDWISKQVSAQEQNTAYGEAVAQWIAQEGPNAPAEWLNDQPQKPEYDDAVKEVALSIMEEDGDAAKEWAQSITEPELRQFTLNLIYARLGEGNKIAPNQTITIIGKTSPVTDKIVDSMFVETDDVISESEFLESVLEESTSQNDGEEPEPEGP